jgi:hypothetical protein
MYKRGSGYFVVVFLLFVVPASAGDMAIARSGNSIEVLLSGSPPTEFTYQWVPDTYYSGTNWFAGLTFGYSHQFDEGLSLGICLHNSFMYEYEETYNFGVYAYHEYYYSFAVWLAPVMILGDKTGPMAVLYSMGFGIANGDGVVPIRVGFYSRNWYLGFNWLWFPGRSTFSPVIETGYSFFLPKV